MVLRSLGISKMMAQQVKAIASEPTNLSSVLRVHLEGENQLLRVILRPLRGVLVPTYKHKSLTVKLNIKKNVVKCC